MRHRLFPLLLGLVVILALLLGQRHGWQWDWSGDQRNRLAPATRALLDALPGPLEGELYLEDYPVQRAAARKLLARFRHAKADFHYRFIDPATHPEALRERGIGRTPTLLLRHGGREARVERLTEGAIARALARLSPRARIWIAALKGHGEARLHGQANFDLGDFGAQLQRRGYRLTDLDLDGLARLPDNLRLLILAAPRQPLPAAHLERLRTYLAQGGNLLWLAEGPWPEALARELHLERLPGVLVDAAAADLGIDRPTVAVGRPADDHPATTTLAAPVLLPSAKALRPGEGPWRARILLQSSPRSWNETGLLQGVIQRDPQQGEVAGPLPLALALERGDQRVAVIGDGDFLSNAYLGNGANRAFGLALVDWLTEGASPAAPSTGEPPDRRLRWSAATTAAVGGFFLLFLPLALAAIGLFNAWRRSRP